VDAHILAAAAGAAGLAGLSPVARLPGHDRNEVWRVISTGSIHRSTCSAGSAGSASSAGGGGAATYVVKHYVAADGDGWAREPAALEALSGSGTVPRLLGVLDEPRLVVMEDLGRAPHLADALLGRDPGRATAALDAWVDALARLHLATDDVALSTFARELGTRAPESPTHQMPTLLEDAARAYVSWGDRLGLPAPDEVAGALTGLVSGFSTPDVALTPGDTCPDNNIVLPGGLRLLDFEGAEIRHPAWDVAYLRVPWPSCWCAWRLPSDVADRGVQRYRDRVAASVEYVGTAAFLADLDLATLGWCLISTAWFLPAALDDTVADEPLGGRGLVRAPGRRALVLHRLWLASHLPDPEGAQAVLTAYARDLYRVLARRWGEPTLVLAPAYREDDIAIP